MSSSSPNCRANVGKLLSWANSCRPGWCFSRGEMSGCKVGECKIMRSWCVSKWQLVERNTLRTLGIGTKENVMGSNFLQCRGVDTLFNTQGWLESPRHMHWWDSTVEDQSRCSRDSTDSFHNVPGHRKHTLIVHIIILWATFKEALARHIWLLVLSKWYASFGRCFYIPKNEQNGCYHY